MSVKDKAAPVSTEPVRPRSSQGTGPRGAPLKVIREREQIPADHISPGNTLTQESSAALSDTTAENRHSVGIVAINSLERDLKASAGNSNDNITRRNGSSSSKGPAYEKSVASAPPSQPMKHQSPVNKEKAATIFVKSSWVPRNEEEVGFLEDEIRKIDKEIMNSGGKMSKEGRKYEITRHGILRRLQKYKAEKIRAARKATAPPPLLPSEQQEPAKPLTSEERKQLDKAAGWIKDKDRVYMEHDGQMIDSGPSYGSGDGMYSNSAYSTRSHNQQGAHEQHQGPSATQLFANRQIAITSNTGAKNGNIHQHDVNTENDSGYNYDLRENVDSNAGPSTRDKNREAALRLVQLSERVESMKRANAEFAAKQQEATNRKQQQKRPIDRITGAHIKRGVGNHNYCSEGGASSAPFANDLTWDKEMY